MNITGKGKITYALYAINIIPLLVFALLLLILGSNRFTKSMYKEIQNELEDSVIYLTTIYDTLYPGDYTLVGEDSYLLYKGEKNLTNDFSIIDDLHEKTGNDYTIYYKDTRILTTVLDSKGNRLVGTGAPQAVIDEVLKTGQPRFYTKTFINHNDYFSYYAPIRNSDGTVTGIAFAGKPTAEVEVTVKEAIVPLIIANIVLILVVSFVTALYTNGFTSSLMKIHRFLKEVASGNLRTKIDPSLTLRNDELGEIARSALSMQQALYTLVEQDALTSLSNRRSGELQLLRILDRYALGSLSFCVALGDIDHFKTVNDTYGHDCGDMILKKVAYILRSHMRGKGFASRWGGEEFLLVFTDMDISGANTILQDITDEIRNTENLYADNRIRVTMTFGLTAGTTGDMNTLLRIVDEKLYTGKSAGRDRIVL